jgi:class 3 adenylate cyclase
MLAADVAGYSRLMAANQAETLGRLRRLRAEVFEPKVARFQGRICGAVQVAICLTATFKAPPTWFALGRACSRSSSTGVCRHAARTQRVKPAGAETQGFVGASGTPAGIVHLSGVPHAASP